MSSPESAERAVTSRRGKGAAPAAGALWAETEPAQTAFCLKTVKKGTGCWAGTGDTAGASARIPARGQPGGERLQRLLLRETPGAGPVPPPGSPA